MNYPGFKETMGADDPKVMESILAMIPMGRLGEEDEAALAMATDLLVWNITKDDIRVREAIVDESAWPAKSPTPPDDPDPKAKTSFTPEMDAGRLDVDKAFKDVIDAFKKKHNLK